MNIASVEDDPGQAALIKKILTGAGHDCESYPDGQSLLRAMRDRQFDLLVMDWQLPDISGYDVIVHIRRRSGAVPPIIFLTTRSLEEDIVAGLAAGADDYMVKPVRSGELTARVAALLRRTYPTVLSQESVREGAYCLDPVARTVTVDGRPVEVSPKEFDVAWFLFRNMDRLLSREFVELAVWGRAMGVGSRTLDSHLSRLRVKLGLRPENGVRLASVYSYGYRFERCGGSSHAG
ncbi:Phosphate regulon transcriptional regulatory protein PhoB [compost metagenome]|uniref:Response regulator transcription factor n=1 Tax=Cupriavidus campinensis TaxID=151783 RepID=A0AAE9L409_9BURK|nr:response regulator transcription factor [Cupriavidus campinensis]TSP13254.1 response regulator transcription factor [Cupriavidus campinensis]URF07617.1 response regulator transcription factor [Cupriavidus campinensis]CAG2147253.1 Phosphate regulon transcriptional regulatory protein PhoB [Cupriavidus campinensis]